MSSTIDDNIIFFEDQRTYKGKVRDVYWAKDKIILLATDRISAFDHILNETIPYKGQVLHQISAFFLKQTNQVVPNWFELSPDPNISIGKSCEPIRLEMVVRGYLCGHAWREYKRGIRTICGVAMPDGMNENDKFPRAIITPSLKADEGHDEDISKEEILANNIVSAEDYSILEDYSLKLFDFGTEVARKQGLILVDTKYEFGRYENQIILMDEVHTPDSSRYFFLDNYTERQKLKQKQKQLSKEFVREWLIEHDFQGKEGEIMPQLPPDFVKEVSERYIELFEKITGQKFERADLQNVNERMIKNVRNVF